LRNTTAWAPDAVKAEAVGAAVAEAWMAWAQMMAATEMEFATTAQTSVRVFKDMVPKQTLFKMEGQSPMTVPTRCVLLDEPW